MPAKRLQVEGWRGISHSFAMVNQHHLLAWMDEPDLQLFHQDLPFFNASWNASEMGSGFDEADARRLQALAAPDGGAVDAVYRIAFPAPFPTPDSRADGAARQVTFMVTEYGLRPRCLGGPISEMAAYTRDGNAVIVPSHWARALAVEFGFPAEHVHVVPHGVQARTFAPYSPEERQARRQSLGFHDQDFVFANVGVATWNKGLDHLLVAFARLLRQYPRARLIVKNNRALYGATVSAMVDAVEQAHPGLLSDVVMDAIFVVDANLDQAALRELYACADCYVSPYRAEGFNLPVLEALACGTPVVVTEGGATDDYCKGPWATRVPSSRCATPVAIMQGGRCLEIDGDALLDVMLSHLHRPADERRLSGPAWATMLDAYSWRSVSRQALAVCFPAPA
jgi:glycosyltransferase involved in cell wall biosynthesis